MARLAKKLFGGDHHNWAGALSTLALQERRTEKKVRLGDPILRAMQSIDTVHTTRLAHDPYTEDHAALDPPLAFTLSILVHKYPKFPFQGERYPEFYLRASLAQDSKG